MEFTIVCQDQSRMLCEILVTVYPPLGIVKLNMACGAANDYLCLSSYCENEVKGHILYTWGSNKESIIHNLEQSMTILNLSCIIIQNRSKAVVPVLVLLHVALWFILRGDLFYVLSCVILFLCFFSPFNIPITSLGEERANLSTFRTFVRFVLVWFCRFSLPLGVWEGLRCRD